MSKKTFKQNPELKEVFTTADGEAFYTRNAAENHAKTLKDRDVKREKNPSLSEDLPVDMDDPNNASLGLIQTGTDADGNPDLKQIVAQVGENGNVDLAISEVNDADVHATANKTTVDLLAEDKKEIQLDESAKAVKVDESAKAVKVDEVKLTPKEQLQKDYQDKFKEVPADHFTKAELFGAIAGGKALVAEINADKK